MEIGSRAIPSFRMGPSERITGTRPIENEGSSDRLILSDSRGGLTGLNEGLEVSSDNSGHRQGNV